MSEYNIVLGYQTFAGELVGWAVLSLSMLQVLIYFQFLRLLQDIS